jgi:hypothetical protein
MRNEGAFLLEWLAHHRAVGFTDFLVFTNDCDDGTDAMLDHLQATGWLTHLPNPGPWDAGPQWAALKRAESHALFKAADWVMVLDCDEFVNIHVGQRRLVDLMHAAPQVQAFAMTWRMFGNAGVVAYEDRPVLKTFTKAAPAQLHWPWRALMVKTLFRNNGRFRKLGVHRPRAQTAGLDVVWNDPSLGSRLFSAPGRDAYGLVQLNHYALGAMESYIVKCDRGRANREAPAFDMSYWCDRNFCDVEDRSILALDSAAIGAELRADVHLAQLHQRAVAWRKARFAQLMAQEPWRALFGRLLMTPPPRALTQDEAALVRQYRKS